MQSGLVIPVLIFAARREEWVSPETCRTVARRDYGAPIELVVYEDAHHGFDLDLPRQDFMGRAVAGDPKATRDSRERMLELLDARLAHGVDDRVSTRH